MFVTEFHTASWESSKQDEITGRLQMDVPHVDIISDCTTF